MATLYKVPTRLNSLLYTQDEILVSQCAIGLTVVLSYLILPPTTTIE
jgi:hypothetical protein